ASDTLDPSSAAAAGVEMGRLLWARCGKKVGSGQWSVARKVGDQISNDLEKNSSVPLCLCGGQNSLSAGQRALATDLRAGPQLAARSSKLELLEQVLKITDLLLQSNGFGMIVLDVADIPVLSARRIPLASWFRFRRAVEHTPTVLLVIEQQPIAG